MKTALQVLVRSTICLVAATPSAATAAAGQAPASDPRVPTTIELALAEYTCGPQTSATTDAAHFECIGAVVGSLRADFGFNLTRLSVSQRNAIDRSCGPRRTAGGRDAYIACVNSELRSLRAKKAAPVPATPPDPAAPSAPVAASVESSLRRLSSTWAIWLIGFLGVGVAAGGGILVAMRARAAERRCRSCGTTVPATADLCPDCRRQAADAIRRAAAERAERQRAHAEGEDQLEQAKQSANDECESRSPREHQNQRQRAREEEDARVRERQPSQVETQPKDDRAATGDDVFDPCAILGVSPGAEPGAVEEAYQQARSKYAQTDVEFLGDEVRSYYKAKADAVERAYRMLAGASAR